MSSRLITTIIVVYRKVKQDKHFQNRNHSWVHLIVFVAYVK